MSIHFRRQPDGSHLATVVMVAGNMVRFFRTVLAEGVDPYTAYGDVAASALDYLNAKGAPDPGPPPKEKPAGRLVMLRAALPME